MDGGRKTEAACVICPLYSCQCPSSHPSLLPSRSTGPSCFPRAEKGLSSRCPPPWSGLLSARDDVSLSGLLRLLPPTSEVPLSFQEPSQVLQMKHFHAGQIVFIEFSSTLSSVLRRDILINYSPPWAQGSIAAESCGMNGSPPPPPPSSSLCDLASSAHTLRASVSCSLKWECPFPRGVGSLQKGSVVESAVHCGVLATSK